MGWGLGNGGNGKLRKGEEGTIETISMSLAWEHGKYDPLLSLEKQIYCNQQYYIKTMLQRAVRIKGSEEIGQGTRVEIEIRERRKD